jgi:hypothetical protein
VKKPVLQSVALASFAVGSMGGAHAAPTSPIFSCLSDSQPSAGGTVSWPPYAATDAPTLTFDFFDGPDTSSSLDCSGGVFSENVVARKSGEGQKDFLKVTMKEVLLAGFVPASDTHIKLGFTQVLGEMVGGVQTYDAYWDITGDYLLSNVDGGGTPSTNFLGIKLHTTQKFDGLSSIKYDYGARELTFSAELQQDASVLSFTSTPRVVDEPGTLALLGTGLLGATALRRRRRSW